MLGGEAVFNSIELSEHTKILFNMGTPVIIRIKIVSEIYMRIGLRLVFAYLQMRGIQTEDTAVFDYCSKAPIPRDSILKIIYFNDPEFSKITEYQNWDKKHQPVLI